jgi:hypothetical protein
LKRPITGTKSPNSSAAHEKFALEIGDFRDVFAEFALENGICREENGVSNPENFAYYPVALSL